MENLMMQHLKNVGVPSFGAEGYMYWGVGGWIGQAGSETYFFIILLKGGEPRERSTVINSFLKNLGLLSDGVCH